ncbi:hypothetical protein A6302_03451 [Methylobrevis pamukkalensis]|uniref:Uncharacterized protein n=1 Tax=Methylobrevis pamukkalensis TaxID=1439726 RepID=A0A1E3GYW1_9HYPH|nr:hypothetical protein A6302_03451 [Methylobrevis pamukkalensis]
MAGELDARLEAAREAEAVDVEHLARSVGLVDDDPLQRLGAERLADAGAGVGANTGKGRCERRRNIGAGIDHGGERDAAGGKVRGRLPAGVIGREDRRAPAGRNAVADGIAAAGPGQHHPRKIVAREHDRPFRRADSNDALPAKQRPEPLARQAVRRHGQMVGDLFQRAEAAAVVGAEHGGAGQDAHVRHGGEFGGDTGGKLRAGPAVDRMALGQKLAAEAGVGGGEDHPGAAAGGGKRRHQPGGAGADHQHVAMGGHGLVAVGIRQPARGAKAGRAADHRLVELFPQGGRPLEGLVVETGHEQPGEQTVDGHHVVIQRRPAVLAGGNEAVVKLDRGRLQIGLGARTLAQGDEGIRLVGAEGEDAAAAMILERASEQRDAGGDQRRGEAVARMAAIVLAVEAEGQARVAVDQTAGGQAMAAHSAVSRIGAGTGAAARRAAAISWVAVLRVTTSQPLQPAR